MTAELRAVSLGDGPIAQKLNEVDYSINRLRMAEGDITLRLVRREMTQIVANLNGISHGVRQSVDDLRADVSLQSDHLKRLLAGGIFAGLLAGMLLLVYLSRSIAGSIRQATTNLLRASGEDGIAPSGGDRSPN